jgi:hypothetical protein
VAASVELDTVFSHRLQFCARTVFGNRLVSLRRSGGNAAHAVFYTGSLVQSPPENHPGGAQ